MKWAIGLNLTYTAISFLWSFIGFAFPTTPVHFHEYALSAVVNEMGGHVLFGALAAAPTLDARLTLLGAGEGILIDSDHILAALNYPVDGRLAHSVFFALSAAFAVSYAARGRKNSRRAVFLVTLSAVAAHLSYDVFAGDGFFPILAPLSFIDYNFPEWAWPILLGLGLTLAAVTWFGFGRTEGAS